MERSIEKRDVDTKIIASLGDDTMANKLLESYNFDFFPSCTPSYDFFSGGKPYTIWQSTTEKYGILRAEKRMEQEKIEFILANKLKDEHRLLLKYTFYEPWKFKGVEWFTKKYHWSKRKYYRIKGEVDKFMVLLDK